MCKQFKKFKRFLGEKVVRRVRIWLYYVEYKLVA